MKLDIGGDEKISAPVEQLWMALNDPEVLTRCIPGCTKMTEISPDAYKVEMQLRVAAVGGSFEGEITLSDKEAPRSCNIKVSGAGSLGHGNGTARFDIESDGEEHPASSTRGPGNRGPGRRGRPADPLQRLKAPCRPLLRGVAQGIRRPGEGAGQDIKRIVAWSASRWIRASHFRWQ